MITPPIPTRADHEGPATRLFNRLRVHSAIATARVVALNEQLRKLEEQRRVNNVLSADDHPKEIER